MSRDKILGWTQSGAPLLLLEFQRAWTCREALRCEACGGLDVRGRMGVPRVNPGLDRHAPDRRAIRRRRRRRRRHAASAGADEGATSGVDTVMAHASGEERGRPHGSRFPFDTVDSASATDQRRPVAALVCWAPAR